MSCGSIHALCDDSLAEILIRLDAVSVLRCRPVCRRWHRIATGRSFLVAHAARRPREMIVKTKHGYARCAIVPPDMMDGRHRYLFDPRPARGDRRACRIDLCASLDGLLVLAPRPLFQEPSCYIICNPVTRQWTDLPALCPGTSGSRFFSAVYGFYFHASSDEFRLLFRCVMYPSEEEEEPCCYYFCIVSAGCTLPPRRLKTCAPVLDERDRMCPVYYHGTLHWLSWQPLQIHNTGMKDGIVAFDTVSETFRPPGLGETRRRGLLELDGELSVATMPPNCVTLDIWALRDYEAGADENGWTLRRRVNVQPPPLSLYLVLPIGSSAILTGLIGSESEARLCSLKEDNNGVHREIIYRGHPTFMVFSESLVRQAFFDLPRCPEIVPLNFSNILFNEDDDG